MFVPDTRMSCLAFNSSLVAKLLISGITVSAGNAPTSAAVYLGLLASFAQAGTVGSVSVII